MSALKKLQHLSLVQKVCEELENHVGINNKDLAEFIIHLASKSTSAESFSKAIAENGATFQRSFVDSLYKIISIMNPVSTGPKKGKGGKGRIGKNIRLTASSKMARLETGLGFALLLTVTPPETVSELRKRLIMEISTKTIPAGDVAVDVDNSGSSSGFELHNWGRDGFVSRFVEEKVEDPLKLGESRMENLGVLIMGGEISPS